MAANRVLTNVQRKHLHDLLLKHGVDPAVTQWTYDGKGWTRDVDTLEAGFCFFVFSADSDGEFSLYMRPGPSGAGPLGTVGNSWEGTLNLFDMWAHHLKQELEQEDPWQKYSAYVPPERLDDVTENSPFTHAEAERVGRSLEEFHDRVVKNLPGYGEVANRFDPQFKRLADQAKKGAGRIDWSNQFVGMVISLCISLSLAPDTASSLWQSWIALVHGLLLP